jgi:hypothetical protein
MSQYKEVQGAPDQGCWSHAHVLFVNPEPSRWFEAHSVQNAEGKGTYFLGVLNSQGSYTIRQFNYGNGTHEDRAGVSGRSCALIKENVVVALPFFSKV